MKLFKFCSCWNSGKDHYCCGYWSGRRRKWWWVRPNLKKPWDVC